MMFQLLSRARAQSQDFRVRSAARDGDTDRSRVSSILGALDAAIREAEQEQSGLSRRVEDVLARAAVTFGNGTDEYLERDALDSHHQTLFSNEISNGQRRLTELAATISHFKFLKAALFSRFPDFKPPAPAA
jgi:predicted outer membrane protein